MGSNLLKGSALAMLLAFGLAACNESDNAAAPPVDEPAQTGSLPAETVPVEPAPVEPAPAPPPAEGQVQ